MEQKDFLYTRMISEQEPRIKYSFSGHESFQCRQLWLKKGFDYIKAGGSFHSESAVVDLGVGKNMVASIRYWLKAFNIVDNKDEVTQFGELLLSDGGYDPFLEDTASLWLLHYQLVSKGVASTYFLIFNEFRKEKIQFNKDSFVNYIKRKAETEKGLGFNPKTVGDDFDVFRKLYLSSNDDAKSGIEDSFSGILTELGLLKSMMQIREENGKRSKQDLFYIENTERPTLPPEILLYSICSNSAYGASISLHSLENDINSPGNIFALNRAGLVSKIEEAVELYPFITYTDQAGIKELQFKKEIEPLEALRLYYEI
ncbi:DUF4007 family protein [Rufibacter roseolus]|uniref:DUF4007 family protein n=1 Tax=Rufibacter roseolus TaxID=2817375 RepID=UPI001FEDF63B|nr:DUF4007 family protein [Rufibacter roseolus]